MACVTNWSVRVGTRRVDWRAVHIFLAHQCTWTAELRGTLATMQFAYALQVPVRGPTTLADDLPANMSASGLYSAPTGRIWCYDHPVGEYLWLESHVNALRSGSGVH